MYLHFYWGRHIRRSCNFQSCSQVVGCSLWTDPVFVQVSFFDSFNRVIRIATDNRPKFDVASVFVEGIPFFFRWWRFKCYLVSSRNLCYCVSYYFSICFMFCTLWGFIFESFVVLLFNSGPLLVDGVMWTVFDSYFFECFNIKMSSSCSCLFKMIG